MNPSPHDSLAFGQLAVGLFLLGLALTSWPETRTSLRRFLPRSDQAPNQPIRFESSLRRNVGRRGFDDSLLPLEIRLGAPRSLAIPAAIELVGSRGTNSNHTNARTPGGLFLEFRSQRPS